MSTIDPPIKRMQRTLEIIEIEDQNLYGFLSNIDRFTIGGISRPSVLDQVRDLTLPGHGLISGCNTFRDNNGRNCYSVVNNHNLVGFNLIQNTMNTAIVRDHNYQPMHCRDQVLNPYRVGLDLNTQGSQGEFNSCSMTPQSSTRSRAELSSIDFSKSLTQLLSSMGNLNENPREEFAIVAACTDNWRQTMGSRHTSQKERLLKSEHSLSAMNKAIQKAQSLNLGVQDEHRR